MAHHRVGLARQMQVEGMEAGAATASVQAMLHALGAALHLPEPWPVRDRVLIDYVVKLTLHPSKMTREDLEPLRAVELDDGDILDIVHVAGYYAYANRIADALGIELEDYRRT